MKDKYPEQPDMKNDDKIDCGTIIFLVAIGWIVMISLSLLIEAAFS